MPSSDRLTSAARDHGETVVNAGTDRLTSAVRGRKKPLLYVGAALALAGAGTAAAATVAASASAPVKTAGAEATAPQATARVVADRDPVARHTAAAHAATEHEATTPRAARRQPAPRRSAASHGRTPHATNTHAAAPHTTVPHTTARHETTPRTAAPKATTPHGVAPHALPRQTATRHDAPHAIARHADTHAASSAGRHGADGHAVTWQRVTSKLNKETNPVSAAHHQLPFADQLTPVGVSGPQSWMPLNQAQVANASTIVKQALAKRMGVRSAVIAVATAMQESGLVNVNYGTGNSLGLFQQQYNMGWGTPSQIMNPHYAADAFLTGLQQYQASNPGWAAQPLWQAAQGVQKSAFPYAYAKWEAQAASLVKQVATQQVASHQGSVTS